MYAGLGLPAAVRAHLFENKERTHKRFSKKKKKMVHRLDLSYNEFRTCHKGEFTRKELQLAWKKYKEEVNGRKKPRTVRKRVPDHPCYFSNEGFFKVIRTVTPLRPPSVGNAGVSSYHEQTEKRLKWLENKGFDFDLQPNWFCEFVHKALSLPRKYRVVSYLGAGVNSVALEVAVGPQRQSYALKVTPLGHSSETNKEEQQIRKVLHSLGIAPRIHSRRVRKVHNKRVEYVLMDTILGSFSKVAETTVVQLGAEDFANQILFVTNKLREAKVVHGDLHLNNLVLLDRHHIGVIDFDLSFFCHDWKKYNGYDLAFLVSRIQMDGEDEPHLASEFYGEVAELLLPHVLQKWKKKGGALNLKLIESIYEAL